MIKIWIIEDDKIMAECLMRAAQSSLPVDSASVVPRPQIKIFANVFQAISCLNDDLPDLILLDIMLTGPDGFTFLNELISYHDTVNIPVIIVTSLGISPQDLSHYNIVDILRTETMTPMEIKFAIERALQNAA